MSYTKVYRIEITYPTYPAMVPPRPFDAPAFFFGAGDCHGDFGRARGAGAAGGGRAGAGGW